MKVISVSRRTDIPALYPAWFMNRIRAGFVLVPNPFNPHQISTVSLRPADVACFVFITKNPQPLLPYLSQLDALGFRYTFQVTLTGLPRILEPGVPATDQVTDAMRRLAEKIGPERLVWRFDPIVLSDHTPPEVVVMTFEKLASRLSGAAGRVVISFVRQYRQVTGRLKHFSGRSMPMAGNIRFLGSEDIVGVGGPVAEALAAIAKNHGMPIYSCAELADLSPFGIQAGSCIDAKHLRRIFGIDLADRRAPGQRKECGCMHSVDIGIYGTCTHRCLYCYARTSSLIERGACHSPDGPALVDLDHPVQNSQPELF